MEILAITTPLEYIKFEQNSSGLKTPQKVRRKIKKCRKSIVFNTFGGDKRDRTADLLNAMFACHEHNA